jgi:hypothetical protein
VTEQVTHGTQKKFFIQGRVRYFLPDHRLTREPVSGMARRKPFSAGPSLFQAAPDLPRP